MATLTPAAILEEGVKAAFTDADADGDKVLATGLGVAVVEFRNTSGGAITVTLDAPNTEITDPVYGRMSKPDSVVELAAGEECAFSLANPFGLSDTSGLVSFSYSTATGLKIRAIKG